jgi:hypothetical protein
MHMRSIPRRKTLALIAALVLATAMSAHDRNALAAIPELFAAPTPNCGECVSCQIFGHAVIGPMESGVVGLHECVSGSSCADHGGCGISLTDDQIGRLYLVVSASHASDVERAIEEFGPVVRYNGARQAVQVDGCNGTVALSIPISRGE